MNNSVDGISSDHAAQLQHDWADVEARIARLVRGPARREFYRRLHGEYRVAMRYSETMCADGLRRYGLQLQMQGLRTLAFDELAGAAEFVIGAYIESRGLTAPELRDVSDRLRAVIDDAVSACGADARRLLH
jgi:hypothetical protein